MNSCFILSNKYFFNFFALTTDVEAVFGIFNTNALKVEIFNRCIVVIGTDNVDEAGFGFAYVEVTFFCYEGEAGGAHLELSGISAVLNNAGVGSTGCIAAEFDGLSVGKTFAGFNEMVFLNIYTAFIVTGESHTFETNKTSAFVAAAGVQFSTVRFSIAALPPPIITI